jgi:hypothetical protein
LALTDAQLQQLLAAIEANNLIVLCGAGLSMPPPSNLLSAIAVSRICFDKWQIPPPLAPALRDDIDGLANHFHSNGLFDTVFIGQLVPWDDLVGPPNSGHAAIADLLISRAVHGVLSGNFDPLIETWAQGHKVAMRGALTGQEAIQFAPCSNPLIKFHGCMIRSREQTLWTAAQLVDPPIQHRIESCTQWMTQNLPGRDLLVIGFWSDWRYLNGVIQNALEITNAHSVTVVDPSSAHDLQMKAPDLWTTLTGLSASFQHVQASGDDALEELRLGFSRTWVKKFYALGSAMTAPAPLPAAATPGLSTIDELYDLRRDAEGTPYNRAASQKQPTADASVCALAHIMVLNAGGTKHGAWFEHGGHSIRIVNGAGQGLATIKARYKEPLLATQPDFTICAGSINYGVPATILPRGSGGTVVRPAAGGSSTWLTLDEAQARLGI